MGWTSARTERDFNNILVESIEDGLNVVLGADGARSVTFYIDPHIAVADPEIYVASVTRLLGTDTGTLFSSILENLHRNAGIAKGDTKGFGQAVAEARRKFQQRSLNA